MKKKHSVDHRQKKRKKVKTSTNEPEQCEKKGEVLTASSIREGMLLLGCVIEVRPDCLLMSLPGCLVGKVSLVNISRKFADSLKSTEEEESEASLSSIVEPGATFPCKVLQVSSQGKKVTISLSIDPQDVNSDLRLSSLYLKMVLYASVQSAEDHGYVMDIGVKGVQAFLPHSVSSGPGCLTVGQVIPTSVRKLPSEKKGNLVLLSQLTFEEDFPEVSDENLKLNSILPGTNVTAYITEVSISYLYMKCLDFEACASAMSLGSMMKNLTPATKVSGSVLYIHPITNTIYLHLGRKPTPSSFKDFFRVKKYDLLKNVKYQYFFHKRLVFKLHKRGVGFIKKSLLERNSTVSAESLLKEPVVPKCRVTFLHYMDNLVELSFNKSLVEMEIVKPEEVTIGAIYECLVKSHSEKGMFVQISPGLSGYVKRIHFSDSLISLPEKMFPIKSRVTCRVLSVDSESFVNLTCKLSLLSLPPEDVLTSFEQAQPGKAFKGVIVHKTDTYFLVSFFNGVRGLVPGKEVPESSIFFVGQTVTCYPTSSVPSKKKLLLSLLADNIIPKSSETKPLKTPQSNSQVSLKKQLQKDSPREDQLEPKKPQKAKIKSLTAHQLNVVLKDGMIGRVHVTQLGCTEENCLPLRAFNPGQKLSVHSIGLHKQKSGNFLAITHRRYKSFHECSLTYPPPCPLQREFYEGMTVMGFIKEVSNASAIVWLSPHQIGVLDYFHISRNPKELRKIKKKLKIGMSLKVTILEVEKKPEGFHILLTKLEKSTIQAAENVVGLVQVANIEQGVVLRLPFGYRGVVCLTDLQDTYSPLRPELEKCRKLGFVLCHVLEVNSSTKFCILSMRKSRLYGVHGQHIEPEVTAETLKEGSTVKGFIQSISPDFFTVTVGRMLEGQMPTHTCDVYGCDLCIIFKKISVGDIVDVRVEATPVANKGKPLVLSHALANTDTCYRRLNLSKDIDWNEL